MEENTTTESTLVERHNSLAERYNSDATIILQDKQYGQEATYEEVSVSVVEGRTKRISMFSTELINLQNNIDRVREIVLTALEDETIDEEVAKDIASRLKFELTREVSVSVQVSFDLTINLAVGEDLDDYIRELEFEVSGAYGSGSEIVRDDYSIEGWD